MKRIFIALFIITAVFACNNPDQSSATGNTVDSLNNGETSGISVDTLPPGSDADSTHQH
jgi:hypothetical protein